MSKIREMYSTQLELAAQIDEVLGSIGTVMILQGSTGVSGSELGDCICEEYDFKYYGRGVYAKEGVLGKMIIVLDKHADGSVYIRSVDVYYETCVISAEEHFSSKKRQRPNLLCLKENELKSWQDEFDKELEGLLDA